MRRLFVDTLGASGAHAFLNTNNRAINFGPFPGSSNQAHFCPRGKGIGGSSAINGMVYFRGASRI